VLPLAVCVWSRASGSPIGEASEKPAVFAEMIERHFPNVPKLEMFARKARDGWAVWGNEVA
jgi:N6-adenosine-specific RNA methylase IME4